MFYKFWQSHRSKLPRNCYNGILYHYCCTQFRPPFIATKIHYQSYFAKQKLSWKISCTEVLSWSFLKHHDVISFFFFLNFALESSTKSFRIKTRCFLCIGTVNLQNSYSSSILNLILLVEWCGGVMVWWSGVVEWWSGGVVWWSGGVVW